MLDCNMFPGLGRKYLESEVNLFLLPPQESEGDEGLTKAGGLSCCSGLPSYTSLLEEVVERLTIQMSWLAKSGDVQCVCVCVSRFRVVPSLLSPPWIQRPANLLLGGLQAS